MMAYRSFEPAMLVAPPALPYLDRGASEVALAGLTPLEWSVVALARSDRLATLRRPGRCAILLGYVFGMRHSPKLASPRLEALRQLAVLLWHQREPMHADELRAFVDAGFAPAQYQLVATSIAGWRAAMKPVIVWRWGMLRSFGTRHRHEPERQ